MITDDEAERAVVWLAESATRAAQARANREHMDEYRRVLRAQLMRERGDQPVTVQEREAYADPRYAEHLDALRTAVEADERFRWLRAAAELRVSLWQSMNKIRNV